MSASLIFPSCTKIGCPDERGVSLRRTLSSGDRAIRVTDAECQCEVDELHQFMSDVGLEWTGDESGIQIEYQSTPPEGRDDHWMNVEAGKWIVEDSDSLDGFRVLTEEPK